MRLWIKKWTCNYTIFYYTLKFLKQRNTTRQIRTSPSDFSYLLSFVESPIWDDDDLILLIKAHHLGYTVRIAWMVDVPGWVTWHGRINHGVVVDTEHVDATVASFIQFLTSVGYFVADQSADVFDDHGVFLVVMGSKQTQTLKWEKRWTLYFLCKEYDWLIQGWKGSLTENWKTL